jgi:hypothetical protein
LVVVEVEDYQNDHLDRVLDLDLVGIFQMEDLLVLVMDVVTWFSNESSRLRFVPFIQ